MVSLTGARRRAEQFAAAVDGRTPVDDLPVELRPLLDLVGDVRELEAPTPRPEFAASLRERLMVEAETALVPASPLVLPPRRRGTRERRLTAAAAIFTLVGGTAGMAAAAQDALPGEALYPIKRGIEDAQLSVQSDADSRGRTYLEQARSRLDEAGRLVEEGASSTVVAESVDEFVVQSVAGADLLLGSYEDQQSTDDVEVLRQFTADTLTELQRLAETAPADIQEELARAAIVLQRIDQQATAACSNCSDLPMLEMPTLMAQAAEVSRAMEAVRSQAPSNDHPSLAVTVPREGSTTGRTGDGSASTGSGEMDEGAGGTAVDSPDLGGTVGTGPLPRATEKALKEVDRVTGGLLGDVADTTQKVAKNIQEGADDVGAAVDDTLEGLEGTAD